MTTEVKTDKQEDDEICRLLKTVADHFDQEDRVTRERQLRQWRRLKLYWNNFTQIYWSETAHDYRIWTGYNTNTSGTFQGYYDRPVNVFRAFLETIIAALSIQIPGINCVPDDAENIMDLLTAKNGDRIAELIYKHNDVIFLWLHALYIYCTEGMIACYSYPDKDKSYGTYDKPKYKDEEIDAYVCPSCGARVPDIFFSDEEQDKYGKDDEDAPLDYELDEEGPVCLECATALDPNLQKSKLIVKRLVGTTQEPKSRICLEVYGGLYVKVANYAKCQEDTPYLNFSYETHYANALECYPQLKDRLPHGGWSNVGVNDPYEQMARLNPQYRGEFPSENVTVKNFWLRPAAFNILPYDDYKKLKKKFSDGARFVMVNDVPAEYENECLDDSWTLTQNPLSDFVNHDPFGELVVNIQDITNDLISLTLQTIEHGIAQTFADPSVVNFAAQKQIEATPGTLTPSKPQGGNKDINQSFYTLKQASLSPEVFGFYQIIQQLGQFVSGALPSIYGGAQGDNSSRTASEYAMQKGMALQRQQTPWRMMTIWWKKIFAKVIPMYIECMEDDEKLVKKNDAGKFINVFIRRAELAGKIGSIELEPDESMPITDEQKSALVLQLMNINNQEIIQTLMDPANLPYIAKVLKMPDITLPGEADREKQFEEIDELVNSAPLPPATQDIELYQKALATGIPGAVVPEEQPSVPIDPDVDNHQIEASICRTWLISEAGRLAKSENPNGYKNVLLHMKAHLAEVAKQNAAQQLHDDQLALATSKTATMKPPDKSGNIPPEKPKEQSGNIQGESDAPGTVAKQ